MPRRAAYGFTLIELGVALLLAGILAIAAAPPISRYIQDYRLDGAAGTIIGDIRLARQRAVAEGNDYVITFVPAENSYTILDDDNNNGAADDGELLLGPVHLPDGVDLENGPALPFPGNTLTLHPDGTASATGIVTVRNRNGRQRVLFVSAATGSARKIFEYDQQSS